MKVIGKRVLVEKIVPAEKTAAGIFIPIANQKQNEGIVLAVGDKTKYIKVGDKVRYYQHAGVYVEHDGKECLFLHEENDIELVL
ncbi:GroES family chaperonin [Flavobacterium sp.]|uniref:GroES family chaperonin n=1 Tax=Flavobacterium sp. TaxID=239 RepID=UPI003D6AC178